MIYRHFPLFYVRGLLLSSLILFFLAGNSCKQKDRRVIKKISTEKVQDQRPFPIEYATGFDLESKKGYYLFHINDGSQDPTGQQIYILVKEGSLLPSNPEGFKIIHIPVKKVILLQTAYVAYFDFCKATKAISGIADAKYVFNKRISENVKTGSIEDIGSPEQINTELIVQMNPDIVIGSGFPDAPNKMVAQLEQMGVPVLMLSDWLEAKPMGRAEWVKLIGFLTGTETVAVKQFIAIDVRYRQLREKAKLSGAKPMVICNLPYRGTWYLPGGKSYIANLLRDAHASYPWYSDQNTGGIRIDFESVFLEGLKADVWINPGSAVSLNDITGVDPRLANFKPVKTGRVYNRYKRVNSSGANDYWESGLVNPHLLLADIISILHPEILPENDLFYYQKLR